MSGCNGRIFLLASRIFDPQNPCHIFYRKNGFTTVYHDINCAIDKCIKNKSKLDWRMAENVFMYLPIKETQPQRQASRLSAFLKNLVKYVI